jgi:hypothetical protein
MNQLKLATALVLIGAIGVWSSSSRGEASTGNSGISVHHSAGVLIHRLPVAPFHDHGFVFAPQP